jgi:hypothetical protein
MTANNALLTDAYTSPLRAQRGAAKRGRYVSGKFKELAAEGHRAAVVRL